MPDAQGNIKGISVPALPWHMAEIKRVNRAVYGTETQRLEYELDMDDEGDAAKER